MPEGLLKTGLLMAGLTMILALIGGLLAGLTGVVIALVLAAVMNGVAYWHSDRLVLAHYDALPVDQQTSPEIVAIAETLARRAGMAVPQLYIIQESSPNAFATGRDPAHAAVAVTAGLLQHLSHRELVGVIAHEMAHIQNRDTLIMTVTATMAGAISAIAQWGAFLSFFRHDEEEGPGFLTTLLLAIVAPIAAFLVQMAISRVREFEADAAGARMSGDPQGLALALQTIESAVQVTPPLSALNRHPETAQLMIMHPFIEGGQWAHLFRTHPTTEERVARLERMAADQHRVS